MSSTICNSIETEQQEKQDMENTNTETVETELAGEMTKVEINEDSSVSPRPSMKPTGNTHNNIFGDPPSTNQKSGKVYHMTSDIFGVGMIIDRDGQHVLSPGNPGNGSNPKDDNNVPTSEIPLEKINIELNNADNKVIDNMPPEVNSAPEVKNSTNGGNPIIGNGPEPLEPKEPKIKSQRRHFQQTPTESLW